MAAFRILAFLIVIGFVDCLPPGNITHTPRKIFRFPQNASTAVRRPPPGSVVMLSPIFFPEYLVPRMIVPSIPRVARPKFSQAVESKFLQAVTSETPQAAKLQVQKKLPEIARNPGRVPLPQPAQPDQLVSASSSSSSRTPSGGWARDKNSTSRIGVGEEQFVFPKDEENDNPQPEVVNRAKFKPNIKDQAPPCAKGSTFCEKVDGYPGNALDNIFDNELDQYKELQGQDELKYVPPITQRIDINVTNEQPLCASIEEIVFPKLAKNKDDNWRYVVNTPSFEQGVRVEKCLKTSENEEQQCFFNDSFPNGYKTVCIQKYIYRRMVAVEDDGKPYKDVFPMPSCCSCAVISVGATFRQGVLRKALRSTTTPPPKH